MKIGTRILGTVVASVVVALVVGGTGVIGIRAADDGARDIYVDNLLPVADVADIRHHIDQQRTALNRALLSNAPDAAATARAKVASLRAESDVVWKRYYPDKVGSDQERAAAERFIASRGTVRPLVDAQLTLLEHDRAAATANMLNNVGPAMEKETTLISELVAVNRKQAGDTYEAMVASGKRAMLEAVLVLVVGAVLVAALGVVLRRRIMPPLLAARTMAMAIRDGQLGHALQVEGNDEFSDTLRALGAMDEQLARIVREVRDNAVQVNAAARDMSAGNDDLSNRTQEQASSLEETAASMEEMAATVKQNAEAASHTQRVADKLRGDARASHEIAGSAVDAMGRIAKASADIGEMAVLIDEIAFQTNLLALNAAVEAARAGEQGRGFTVVAAEVRSLAQRSAKAAKEIRQLIASTREEVGQGVSLVQSTGDALAGMVTDVGTVSGLVSEIAAASVEQAAGVEQVNHAVTALDEVTQQNAALVEEASAASRTTLDLADSLMRQVAFFRLGDEPAAPSPAVASGAAKQGQAVAATLADSAGAAGRQAVNATVGSATATPSPGRRSTAPAAESVWQEF